METTDPRFTPIRTFGKGAFATVQLVRRKPDGKLLAVKTQKKKGKTGIFAQAGSRPNQLPPEPAKAQCTQQYSFVPFSGSKSAICW